MKLTDLAKIGNFGELNRLATTSTLTYLESIDLIDVGVKDLNSLGKILVRLIKRARVATSNRDLWDEVITKSFLLAYEVIDALSAISDDCTVTEKSTTISWLRELTALSEQEQEIDDQQSPEFTIEADELASLMSDS